MAEDADAGAAAGPKSLYYVLVSVPAPDGVDSVYRTHVERTADVASTSKLQIPELKVGTLDTLMSLSDQLSKLDGVVEAVIHRMSQQLSDLVGGNASWQVNGLLPDIYLGQFQWELKKFAPDKPLTATVAAIQSTSEKVDIELRNRSATYTTLARSIAADTRKDTGTLMTKALLDIVKPESLTETEYLTTLLIVVPKHLTKEWLDTYESLTSFVLPRSATQLAEDSEFALFSVVLFKRVAEEFKNIAREKRYTVREYTKDTFSKETKEERAKRIEEKSVQEAKLIKWIKATVGDMFLNWVHLKIIRAHVESVLRYGLPPKYALFLMKPKKKDEKRVMGTLTKLYGDVAGAGAALMAGSDDAIPGSTGASEKYYPFVYNVIDLDLSRGGL
eukprot:m51a1_g6850 putative v-type proton atpase subunit c 1-a-like (389) ;mRNA; r:96217-97879